METLEEYYEDARRFASANDVSPAQCEKIFTVEKDPDLFRSAILKAKENPDIEYLINKYGLKKPMVHAMAGDLQGNALIHALTVGDAIGAPYEFSWHSCIDQLKYYPEKVTDDTQLAVAVQAAVNNNPKKPKFRKFFLKAYQDNPNLDYGGGFIRWAQGRRKHLWERELPVGVVDNTKGYHSIGNGCLSRSVYIPAFYCTYSNALKTSISSCMATHNNAESIKAVILWTNCLWLAIGATGDDQPQIKRQIYNMILDAYSNPSDLSKTRQYDFLHATDACTKESDDSLYAGYALCMVVSHFYHAESVTDALLNILKSFCDADSLCAMECVLWKAFDGSEPVYQQ